MPALNTHTQNMATNEGQEEVDCVEETTTFTSVIDFVFLGDAGKSSGHVHIELMVLFICALTKVTFFG